MINKKDDLSSFLDEIPAQKPENQQGPKQPDHRTNVFARTKAKFGHQPGAALVVGQGRPPQAGQQPGRPPLNNKKRTYAKFTGRPQKHSIRALTDVDSPSAHYDHKTNTLSTSGQAQQKGGKGRNRYNARRPHIGNYQLPPTDIHHGKIGKPKDAGNVSDDTLKIIALGGLGEIGKNMYLIEYRDDIVIIDAGLMFPDDNMPGIDFLIANTEYLYQKRDNIRGLVLTHGHMDHIGGIPYLMDKIGNPEIYTAQLTRGIVLKRQAEFPHLPKLNITIVKSGDRIKLGDFFEVEFFHMNHNIPDDLGVLVSTPIGNVIHTADFKFDSSPVNDKPVDLEQLRAFGDRGVLALMCDSTDAETTGHSISEQTIYENLELIFQQATGMLIAGTFSSMINRIQQMVMLCEKYDRKIIFDGFSLKSNIEIAKELGYVKIQKGTEISKEQIGDFPRDRIMVVATGAQGEESASLMRIVNREHRHITIQKNDTVIFSSSVVPGNERSVQRLKDMLYRGGVRVFHYKMMDIHAGGHARQEDLKQIIELLRPKYLMPIHGQYSMMVTLGKLGIEKGVKEENILISDNGQIIHLTPDHWWIDKETAPSSLVMVDGLGVGDIGNVVLRDRQVLAEDGMFVIIALLDTRNGLLKASPDIISRGFVYLKDNKDLLAEVRKKIRHIVASEKSRPMNVQYLKDVIRDEIGRFLFQHTERRPMVLPVIIEV